MNVPLYATERTASPGEFPVLAVLFCAMPLRCCELVVGLLDAPVSHTFFGGDFGLILVFRLRKTSIVTCLVFLLFCFIENKFSGFLEIRLERVGLDTFLGVARCTSAVKISYPHQPHPTSPPH